MLRNLPLVIALFITYNLKAQHVDLKQVVPLPYNNLSGHSNSAGACDSLNLFAANNWSAYFYEYRGGGFALGTNNLNATQNSTILENANYFDVSASDYTYISGGLVYFAFANSNKPENLDKTIQFKLYDDNEGLPGTVLGSALITLNQVHQDVLNGDLSEFKFASPIALPASKKFYVSVDNSNFAWSFKNKDSIAIVGTQDDQTPNNTFQLININQSGAVWTPLNHFWRNDKGDSLDVTLFIFPYVSNSAESCSVLATTFFNFEGYISNNQAYLNWSTATENNNNKGFYVERSIDGRNFTSIGFVKSAGASTNITHYAYTDITLKDLDVSTIYFRLKQVDIDEKFSYSKVLPLSLQNLAKWRIYPNPVKEEATIELNLDIASKVSIQVISQDGKVLLNSDKGVLNGGFYVFPVNMRQLAKGAYNLRLMVDKKIYSQVLVKQ